MSRALCAIVALVLAPLVAAGPLYAQSHPDRQLPRCATKAPINAPREYRDGIASFEIDVLGNVLYRPSVPVDEDDDVIVYVHATDAIAHHLRIQRLSQIRPVGTIAIAGEGIVEGRTAVNVIADAFKAPTCIHVANLSDFSPGRGEVGIFFLYEEANALKETSLGSFDFRVNPLYTGAFSVGAVRSELEGRDFRIVPMAADSIISVSETGNRILYTLMYTPFIWGKRDLEKSDVQRFWQHVNPVFGVVLNDISENALGGISIDLPGGLFLHWGAHVGKAVRLDPHAEIELGEPIPSGMTAVPTT